MRAQRLQIEPSRPNPRRLREASECLSKGGVIAYPTDTVYGLAANPSRRKAIDRIYRAKQVEPGHRLSLICNSLSMAARYAHVSDFAHRWLRRLLPGPYTVILPATRLVPKVLLEKRREIGIRIPESPVCSLLVEQLDHPILSTSATDPQTRDVLIDADAVLDCLGGQLDLVVDGGMLTNEPSTIISLIDDEIAILRRGKGPTGAFE